MSGQDWAGNRKSPVSPNPLRPEAVWPLYAGNGPIMVTHHRIKAVFVR